jgi:hypothetical protein
VSLLKEKQNEQPKKLNAKSRGWKREERLL